MNSKQDIFTDKEHLNFIRMLMIAENKNIMIEKIGLDQLEIQNQINGYKTVKQLLIFLTYLIRRKKINIQMGSYINNHSL